jgi:hypothetical protein
MCLLFGFVEKIFMFASKLIQYETFKTTYF